MNQKLFKSENKLTTTMGAFFPGERVVYRGKDLHKDLKDKSWLQLVLLGATGKDFTERQVKLLSQIWVLTISYPDPRLWNNRIAALAGAAKATSSLGSCAAMAISDAKIFGHTVSFESLDFLKRVEEQMKKGQTIKDIVTRELKQFRYVPGFGRPIVSKDERIEPLLALAKQLDFDQGFYLELGFKINDYFKSTRYKYRINALGIVAALTADQGLSPLEFYHLQNPAYYAGILPCYIDAASKPEGTFFPFRCTSIVYKGVGRRSWNKN